MNRSLYLVPVLVYLLVDVNLYVVRIIVCDGALVRNLIINNNTINVPSVLPADFLHNIPENVLVEVAGICSLQGQPFISLSKVFLIVIYLILQDVLY